jgi:hypothetical protein
MAKESRTKGVVDTRPGTGIGTSLDELAKGLASGTVSRAKALRLVGSALLGAALASVPGMAWAACPAGQTRCNDRCVNLQTSENHCGSCRNRCRSTQTCCKGRCVNLQGNERHCGSCLHRCDEGEECVGGVCQGEGCPPDPACTESGGTIDATTCHCICTPPLEHCESDQRCVLPQCGPDEFFDTQVCVCQPLCPVPGTVPCNDPPAPRNQCCTEGGRIWCDFSFTCDPGCACGRTVEGPPFCADADFLAGRPCSALQSCTSTTECPVGYGCINSGCPGNGICAPACGVPGPA